MTIVPTPLATAIAAFIRAAAATIAAIGRAVDGWPLVRAGAATGVVTPQR
jgi:hypothetical protein